MVIRTKYADGAFRPVEKMREIEEKYKNKEVEIEIIPKLDELVGVLKDLKTNSVELQHKIKDMW